MKKIGVFSLFAALLLTSPLMGADKSLHLTHDAFTDLLEHPDKRRAQSAEKVVALHKQFADSLAGNTLHAGKTEEFIAALWRSSLDKTDILNAAKKVEKPLALLATQNNSNHLATHLLTALQKHTTAKLPDLISLKRQYSRTAEDDYRLAQSVGRMLFHNPGTKVGLLGATSAVAAGVGLHMFKKHNTGLDLMTLQHHVLRHKMLQDYGSADLLKLKEILSKPPKKMTPKGRELIEKYLSLDATYRQRNKLWIKSLGGAAVGGLGTAISALIYKNQTPLQTIK